MLKKIAKMLDGMEYSAGLPVDTLSMAKENNIVIVYGASDDLMEFDGAVLDEAGCYDGGIVHVDANGLVPTPDCDCEWALKWHEEQKANAKAIRACWCEEEPYSWTYETDILHECFDIMEDGEKYCRGIVFSLDRLVTE